MLQFPLFIYLIYAETSFDILSMQTAVENNNNWNSIWQYYDDINSVVYILNVYNKYSINVNTSSWNSIKFREK